MSQTKTQLVEGLDLASAPADSLVIDSIGRVLVGASTARSSTGAIQVETAGTTDRSRYEAFTNINSAAGTHITLGKSRGTTAGSNTIVQISDELGALNFHGTDGANDIRSAQIKCAVDGTPGTNDMPGRLVFSTTADGESSPTERMRIHSNGRVSIGTTAGNDALCVQCASDEGLLLQAYNTTSGAVNTGPYIYGNIHDGNTTRAAGDISFLKENGTSGNYATYMKFRTRAHAGSPTEQMRIDSSGRLLVGTSTARADFLNSTFSARFQVEGTGHDNSAVSIVRNSADGGAPYLNIGKTRGPNLGSSTVVQSGDGLGVISFQGADGSEMVEAAAIIAQVDGTPGANDMPGRLVFSTTADGASSPTERMRISENGQIEITGPGYTPKSNSVYLEQAGSGDFWIINRGNNFIRLGTNNTQRFLIANDGYLYAQTTATGNTNLTLRNNSTAADSTDFFQLRDNANNLELVIKPDGDVENANNSYTGFSDVKLKENIVDASSQWEDIKALRVRNYNYKESTGYSTHKQIGVIAQELELVSPGLVKESIDTGDGPDGEHEVDLGTTTKSVNYSVLYMKAVKALQEAMERIETLEANNVSLEARLAALEAN